MSAPQSPRINWNARAVIPVSPTSLDLPDELAAHVDRIVAAEVARTGNRADVVRIGVHAAMVEKLMVWAKGWMA